MKAGYRWVLPNNQYVYIIGCNDNKPLISTQVLDAIGSGDCETTIKEKVAVMTESEYASQYALMKQSISGICNNLPSTYDVYYNLDVDDCIDLKGKAGEIEQVTVKALNWNQTPTVTTGGTKSLLTIELGIPSGKSGTDGASGMSTMITSVSATTLDWAYDATVTTGGSQSAMTLNFGIPSGRTFNITAGTTTTLPPEEDASVSSTAIGNLKIFTFKIPRGKDGSLINQVGYYDINDSVNTISSVASKNNVIMCTGKAPSGSTVMLSAANTSGATFMVNQRYTLINMDYNSESGGTNTDSKIYPITFKYTEPSVNTDPVAFFVENSALGLTLTIQPYESVDFLFIKDYGSPTNSVNRLRYRAIVLGRSKINTAS